MAVGSLQTELKVCLVRWADNFIPVLKPINEVAVEPEERASRAEEKSKYSWVPLGEALRAMTTGDAVDVYIPAPPDENGQERVWAWINSGKMGKENLWYCAGPVNSQEALKLAATWNQLKDGLNFKVEVKGAEPSLGGLPETFDVTGSPSEPLVQAFVDGLMEYFTQIEEEKGHAPRRRQHRYPFIPPRFFRYDRRKRK